MTDPPVMSNQDESTINLRPPSPLKVADNHENLAQSWRLWIQAFNWYAETINLAKRKPTAQVAIFMTVIGQEAIAI
ncbi:Hypothetical protein NTJ_04370 [Nesidiocoris tenuis]|uniref:Uncharacterized protein n=1 Tax=Nesidiocoris tenuis TaxID=355587 RepID=A0ABN7AJW3_9HEMI|nr:Hypothetical protein NTJ_04370 [Nesidiocoris tenuis]